MVYRKTCWCNCIKFNPTCQCLLSYVSDFLNIEVTNRVTSNISEFARIRHSGTTCVGRSKPADFLMMTPYINEKFRNKAEVYFLNNETHTMF